MTFNSIVLNALSPSGVKEQNTRNGMICVFGKAIESELLKKVAGYTILLTKWELEDDLYDLPNLRSKAASLALGRAIRRSERSYPEYDECVAKGFEELKKMEQNGNDDPVVIGKRFASSLIPAMADIAGDIWSQDLEKLFIGLGTAVYVMDAVDDLDEDYLNDTFNPFLIGCDDYVNKTTFIQKNVYLITDMISSVMKEIKEPYMAIRDTMRFHHGIADNIILRGIPDSAKRVISCECNSRPSIRNSFSSRVLRRET
jgi:hypothetical protein